MPSLKSTSRNVPYNRKASRSLIIDILPKQLYFVKFTLLFLTYPRKKSAYNYIEMKNF